MGLAGSQNTHSGNRKTDRLGDEEKDMYANEQSTPRLHVSPRILKGLVRKRHP